MENKLTFFESRNIHTLQGKIKLSDLIEQIKKSKSSKTIIDFAKDKTKIYDLNGHCYIDIKTVIKIFKEFKNKHTEKMLIDMQKQEFKYLDLSSDTESNDGTLTVSSKNEIMQNDKVGGQFNFWGHTFNYIIVDEKDDEGDIKQNIYFNGKEIAEFLEYADTDKAIRKFVDNEYKKNFKEIFDILKFNPAKMAGLKENWKKTIYINKYGLIQLITKSNKAEAKKFQKNLIEKVVPSLLEKNYYIPNNILVINWDTSFIVAIDKIEQYYGYKVVYMIVIGLHGIGLLIKYGYTNDIKKRLEDHKKTYKPQNTEEGWESTIKLIYVAKTDNNNECENVFRQLVKNKRVNVEMVFQGENRVELFTTNNSFTLENAKNEMTRIVKSRKSKIEQEKDEYVKNLKSDNQIKILQIETNKEIEIKKIECNRDIKIAEEDRMKEEAIAKQFEERRKLKELEINEKEKEEQKKNEEKQKKEAEEDIKKKEEKQKKEYEEEIKREKENKNNIFWQYLDKNTVECKNSHVHCAVLYSHFKDLYKETNNDKPPSNKEFCDNIKKYKDITKVWIRGTTQLGIRDLKIK